MKMRLFLAMIPCLMMVACGLEAEPESTDNLRGDQVEPCLPEDCIPLAPQGSNDCPEGTEPASGAECVNSDGECVWEFWEACVPVEGNPPPPPEDPPYVHPSEGSPRDIAPRPS